MIRLARVTGAAILAAAALWWLRDPPVSPWLETGLRPWTTTADGTRFRWTMGRASFFVPREWTTIDVPLRAQAFTSAALPVVVALSVDGHPVDRVTLRDERWVMRSFDVSTLRSSRRFRRVDLRVNRVWSDQHLGVQLGVVRSGRPE